MAPKQKAQQQPAQRYLGQKDPKTGKVWAGDGWGWQAPATYTRLAGRGELNTQRNPMNWVNNNLAHLLNTSNSLNKGTKLEGHVGFLPIYSEPGGGVSSSTPAQRQVAHGATVQPLSNAAMATLNLGQRLLSGEPLKSRKPEGTRAGQAIQRLNDQAAVAMGAKPVGQLTQSQRDLISSLPSSIATNTALAFVPGLRVGAAAFSGMAAKVPFLSPGAQQVLARGLRWGANAGLNEAASGLLDDSTQGQAGDLLKAVGAPVPDAFVTQPEDDRISAGVRGIIPGIAFGELLGAPLGVLSKATELAPNAMRVLREQRTSADVARVRQETVNAGLQQPDDLGGFQFTRDVAAETGAVAKPASASPQPAAAGAEPVAAPVAGVVDPAGATAPAPDAGLAPSPELTLDQLPEPASAGVVDDASATPSYDPSLLEVDAAALALDRLDDGQLTAVAQGQGPVLPRLEEAMASQQLPEVDGGRSTRWTAAPAESLAAPATPWREQWEGLPNNELLGAADPQVSPDLFEKTAAITGRDWSQFTRTDVLDGLSQLEVEGQVVLPQRLGEGQVLADVGGLQVDPARMQFRAGADPESGVVPGQGIEGPWDVSKESKVAIWQDPQTGDQVLVDGHRRVDAARRLGIPSLPAEEVLAPTADAARAQGAMRNIQEGTASPLDGGRALRQQGLMDPSAIEGAGLPLGEGTAAGSAAIAGLPDAVFRATEAGELPMGRAMAIGGSGLDANGQMAALRFARSPRSAQLDEAAFGELMQMAGASQRGAGAVAEDGAPIKAPSVLDFDRLASKAQLAAVARQGLSGRALELFDQGKVNSADAVSQLLDQAAAEVAGGSRMDVVGRRLQRQIEQAEKTLPPVEAAAAVEQAMPEAQGPMTAADRQALRAQVLQQAIDGGELRPSSQPIIPSPDPLQVDVPAAMRDLEQQLTTTGTIAPDTPAARLLEEEARLEAEYGARDAVVAEELRRAQREAADFWNLPFSDRVRQGLISDGRLQLQSTAPDAPRPEPIPQEVVKPYEELSNAQEARSVAEMNRLLGTNDVGLDLNGGYTFTRRKMEVRGQVDLDAWLGADRAKAVREEFAAGGQLTPAALAVRESLRDFYGVKPTTSEKPFYIELGGDDAAINRVSDELRAIVREIAGPDADVRLSNRYKYDTTTAEWGGDGQRQGRIHGSYNIMRDLVEVNGVLDGTQRQLTSTAYHEAFHRVQYGLLTQQEMKVMDSAFGLSRISNYSGLSPDKVATMERMAVAFQNYATVRRGGGDLAQRDAVATVMKLLPESTPAKVAELAVAVAQAFDKVLNVIDRARNFAQGNGFQTLDDVFDRVYRGDIARERAFSSALELLEPDQVARAKTLQRWRKDNAAPRKDVAAALSNLDAQIEALKTKALSGGC